MDFHIKVYTDTICPWYVCVPCHLPDVPLSRAILTHRCYIGHKTLSRAIAVYQRTYPGGSRDRFLFDYAPFYLDPSAPAPGVPWQERVAQKNGADKVNAIRTRLERVGRAAGIAFRFEGTSVGSTRDSHRLLRWVRERYGAERQRGLLEGIQEWHFEGGGDVSSRPGLVAVAAGVGVQEEEAKAFLEGEELGDVVDEMAARARREERVREVPTVEIDGVRVGVQGAAEVGEFLEAIIKARERKERAE